MIRLTRLESTDQGTFGILRCGRSAWFTGELPWRDNRAGVSCVPTGAYRVAWIWSPHFRRNTFRLLDVPGRSGILIHPSNLMGDSAFGYRVQLRGCVSLGERLGCMAGQRALLLSAPAVRGFEELMRERPFTLEIRNA